LMVISLTCINMIGLNFLRAIVIQVILYGLFVEKNGHIRILLLL
jgi:hypothetical protein